jgi:hypothetical protein
MKALYSIALLIFGTAIGLFGQQRQNLLQNPGALQGNLDGWEIIENGGDGWGLNIYGMNGTSCFATSYARCSKSQLIDLLEVGYSEQWLDRAPIVLFSDWYKTLSFDHDIYFLNVELLDANDNVMASYSSGDLTTTASWQQVKGHFLNYGQGLRKIRFTHGGEDTESWAGQFGAAIDGSYLSIGNHAYYSGGSTGTLAGWDIISDGGNGWAINGLPGVFTTSYSWCSKSQTIDLWEYYSAELLDLQPKIDAWNFAKGHDPNYQDQAQTIIRLLDNEMNILAEYNSDIVELSESWAYYGDVFTSYGTGLRYVYFEHGGRDAEFWDGNFGAQFDDTEVLIDFNTLTSSEDIVTASARFSVFPNPAREHITVEFEIGTGEGYLSVLNLYGQPLRQVTVNGQGSVQLSLQELPRGTYLLHLQSESGIKTQKLILN